MMSYPRINIGNVLIDNVTMEETLSFFEDSIIQQKTCFVATPNIDHIVRYNRDPIFAQICKKTDLVLADGMPLLWAAKFLGTPLKEKVSGSDLMPRVCEMADAKGYKLFFLGGRPGAAEAAKNKLQQSLINLKVVGIYAPPMGFEKDDVESKKITMMIKESKPDILFVGLGSPKQEKWIYDNYLTLHVPVSIGIGVTFEFIAGIVKRAPKWMQNIGLEWFWRLCMEPGRLWKRYLIDDTQFFGIIWKQKLRGK